MKILRPLILGLAILISIFFVVYANIQTNLALEKEQFSNQLMKESQLNEVRATLEIEALKQKLEECQLGQGE